MSGRKESGGKFDFKRESELLLSVDRMGDWVEDLEV